MQAPPSTPDPQTHKRVISAGGTIVGMPAVIPSKADRDAARHFEQLRSTTLRSVYSVQGDEQTLVKAAPDSDSDSGPCSDAFHPERWSNPPPSGVEPIYPCDDPDDESEAGMMPALEARARLAAFAERNAEAAVAETQAQSEEAAPAMPDQPPSPWSASAGVPKSDVYVDEFAYIPMRRSAEDRRLLVIAAMASGGVILAALSALTVLL
jgi:hypothetical protein